METKKCPHCDYNCPTELFEKHLKVCVENKEGKNYRPKIKYLDKFFLCPIASLILVISFFLVFSFGGALWGFLIIFSSLWIYFRKTDYETGEYNGRNIF